MCQPASATFYTATLQYTVLKYSTPTLPNILTGMRFRGGSGSGVGGGGGGGGGGGQWSRPPACKAMMAAGRGGLYFFFLAPPPVPLSGIRY